MKHALVDVVAAATALRAAGEAYVLATVVRVRGSSYRRPGARLIATARGERVAGSISGGCLEAALLRTAWWRTASGPCVVEIDSSDPDDPGAVLGCGGVVEVLLERGGAGAGAATDAALAFAGAMIAAERRAAIATVFASTRPGDPMIGARWFAPAMPAISGMPAMPAMPASLAVAAARAMASGKATIEHAGALTVLVEPVIPPLSLFVFGAGLDAVPIVDGAARLGWRTHVWSGAARFEHAQRFTGAGAISHDLAAMGAAIDRADRAAAIVMSHDLRRDREALAVALASRAAYIGVLGPRHRTLSIAPPAALADPRVHAPVGLDLGAEAPDEIALAVIAEILADTRAASAIAMRERAVVVPRIAAVVPTLG